MNLEDCKRVVTILSNENLLQPKVLLIEDCQFDTALTKKYLHDYYPMTLIDHAETRVQALEFLENNIYDVVLLDLNLPDSTGLDDIAEFRTRLKQALLIIITGQFDEEARAKAKEHGADGIVSKEDLVKSGYAKALGTAVENIVLL